MKYFLSLLVILISTTAIFSQESLKTKKQYKPRVLFITVGESGLKNADVTLWKQASALIQKKMEKMDSIEIVKDSALLKRLKEKQLTSLGADEYSREIDLIKSIAYDFFIDQIDVLVIKAGKKEEPSSSLNVRLMYYPPWKNETGFGPSFDLSAENMENQIEQLIFNIRGHFEPWPGADRIVDFNQRVIDMRTGKQVSLSMYKGKPVLFYLLPPEYILDAAFFYSDYPALKELLSALKFKYPDLEVIVGLNRKPGKIFHPDFILNEILKDKDFPYPIYDLEDYGKKFFDMAYSSARYRLRGIDGNIKYNFLNGTSVLEAYNKLKVAVPESQKNSIRKTLTEAARDNDFQSVNQLLNEGNKAILSEDTHNALDWAMFYGNNAMWDILINHGVITGYELFHAAYMSIALEKDAYLQSILQKMAGTDVQIIKELYGKAESVGNSNVLSCLNKKYPDLVPFIKSDFDYHQMLLKGMKPGIDPSYQFPVSGQRFNSHTCELFAMKHILKYKYNENIDVDNWEKMMHKGHYDPWLMVDDCGLLMKKIGIEYGSNSRDIGIFFYYLCKGEPIITEREFGKDHHSHSVVAYSFDEKGVWLSDSANDRRWNIDYDTLFKNRWFVVRTLRKIATN